MLVDLEFFSPGYMLNRQQRMEVKRLSFLMFCIKMNILILFLSTFYLFFLQNICYLNRILLQTINNYTFSSV